MRTFEDKPAIREQVPLMIGEYGPSGCGKTYSALRLATGIQRVTGGDIYGIDSESKRMLHYADLFKFKHVEFKAPFGPLDYLAAIEHCYNKGGKIIIIDSASHEHEGPGGVLESHEREVQRLAGDDSRKAERVNMLAWAKPKAERRKLINSILQMNANFIFCFRAKEKVKLPKKGDPDRDVKQLGFMPIAGEEYLYEMTLNCLLLPNSGGVPSWHPEEMGEKAMVKLPVQFKQLLKDSRPLDEAHGESLALWAKGTATVREEGREASRSSNQIIEPPVPSPLNTYLHCKDQIDNAGSIEELQILWKFTVKHKASMTGAQFTEIEALKNRRKRELMVTA